MTCRGLGAASVLCVLSLVQAGIVEARNVRDNRDPSTGGSAYALMATPVFEFTLWRDAGQTTTCETRNSSANADPVIHILPFSAANGAVAEIARDDDSGGGLEARVTFRATTTGRYRLVMRAAWAGGAGTTDLYCDGRPVWLQLAVGGTFKTLKDLRQRERLITVTLPAGPRLHRLYLLGPDGRLMERHENGASESVLFSASPSTMQIAMLAVAWPDPAGNVRLIRDDSAIQGHDPDRDGLGHELERHIGTCSTLNEVVGDWSCSRTTDPRDTDGDGIQDGIELVGLIGSAPYQWLPRWGADPRHKDLFVEVDFRPRESGESNQTMKRDVALELAGIYADPEMDPLLRLAHAQALNNPDLQPGIRLHLDTGVTPPGGAPAAELTTYGDWGGHDVMPVDAESTDVRASMMHGNRRGIFTYAGGEHECGGQTSMFSIALNLPMDCANVAAHELGHTLGLGHAGPDGATSPVADIPEPNCKPNYPSVMSYAYLGKSKRQPPQFPQQTFSDGFGRAALNNISLVEKGVISQPNSGPGRVYLDHLENVFNFNVVRADGHVDWDRDGVIAEGTTRAYANDNGNSCELTRMNEVRTRGLSDGAPALARVEGRTVLIYNDERDRRLHVEFSDDDFNCPMAVKGCGEGLQHRTVDEGWNQGILNLDAHPVRVGAQTRLLVVFTTEQGLFETTMSRDFDWSQPIPIRTSTAVVDEPSLTGLDSAILAYKNAQGFPVLKRRSRSGRWGPDEPIVEAGGSPIGPLGFLSAPAILQVTTRPGLNILLGAFPVGPKGVIKLYVYNPFEPGWIRASDPAARPLIIREWEMAEVPSFGRPALAFEPVAEDSPLPGRLRLLFLRRAPDNHHPATAMTLQARGFGDAAKFVVEGGYHDNVWLYGYGVDLLFEPGVDSNLRAAISTAPMREGSPLPHAVVFRPKADGIVDLPYRNWNDWEALGVGLCWTRKWSGAEVNCPQWPIQ